jgi:hypothetical protein
MLEDLEEYQRKWKNRVGNIAYERLLRQEYIMLSEAGREANQE